MFPIWPGGILILKKNDPLYVFKSKLKSLGFCFDLLLNLATLGALALRIQGGG